MKKKVLFIVMPIVLAIIIVGIIAIAVIGSILNKNKSVGTTWGDTYYAYLKEAINEKDLSQEEEKFGMQLGMKDAKISFYDIEESENPSMVMTYSKDENNYVNVYQINNDNKVTYVAYKQPSEAEYLYNIENENYNWYIHENSSTSDSYILLKNIVDKLKNNSDKSEKSSNVNIAEIEADYTIRKDEVEISQETTDGNKITIKKFDQIFVKPEIEPNEQIDFNIDIKEDDLKKSITNVVTNFKKESEKLTSEVKESVKKKVEEAKETVKKIEEAKEEVRKKEEEAKKKAEEEANAGIKVGQYTLKYGKYVGMRGTDSVTIVFNSDGTCQVTANYGKRI